MQKKSLKILELQSAECTLCQIFQLLCHIISALSVVEIGLKRSTCHVAGPMGMDHCVQLECNIFSLLFSISNFNSLSQIEFFILSYFVLFYTQGLIMLSMLAFELTFVAQANLEFAAILLPQPPQDWDYRHALPYQTH